jgi:hypothetical protein
MSSAINGGATFSIMPGKTTHWNVLFDGGDWDGVGVFAAKSLTPGSPLRVSNVSVKLETDGTYKWFFTITNDSAFFALFQIFAGTG